MDEGHLPAIRGDLPKGVAPRRRSNRLDSAGSIYPDQRAFIFRPAATRDINQCSETGKAEPAGIRDVLEGRSRCTSQLQGLGIKRDSHQGSLPPVNQVTRGYILHTYTALNQILALASVELDYRDLRIF
jgi:hypothetical protein